MKKILVVDDERPISDIIKFNLTKEGYEVVTAFDGREALEQFEAENPDLVILDLMLPELDGLEVAKEIRKTVIYRLSCFQLKIASLIRSLAWRLGQTIMSLNHSQIVSC